MGDQTPVAGSYSSALAEGAVIGALTPHDEHLAVGQQRGGVTVAPGHHAAGGRPGTGGRIIQFRACRTVGVGVGASATSTLPLGSSVAVEKGARGAEAAGGGKISDGRRGGCQAARQREFRGEEAKTGEGFEFNFHNGFFHWEVVL